MNPDPNVAYPPPTKKKGPNWFIILPCGCLSIIGLIVVGVAVVFMGVFGALKGSDAYKESLAKAQASPQIKELLGEPIKDTFVVGGSVSTENGAEKVELVYPITGPKGAGAVTVSGEKPAGGTWTYTQMQVVVTADGKDTTVNLLEE